MTIIRTVEDLFVEGAFRVVVFSYVQLLLKPDLSMETFILRSLELVQRDRLTDRQTAQADGQTDLQRDRSLILTFLAVFVFSL